jgi:hypothetical protein
MKMRCAEKQKLIIEKKVNAVKEKWDFRTKGHR